MALQEEGWPLGLLSGRIGLVENGSDFSGSLLTTSPSCFTHSCSDLESQSPGSLSHEKAATLGTLLEVELSQRSRTAVDPKRDKNKKMKAWLRCLCSRQSTETDAVSVKDVPSLGHYLEAERRASTSFRFSHFPPIKRSNSLS